MKLKFKDVVPNYICAGSAGWEIRIEDGKPIFPSGMKVKDRREARDILKGMKLLVQYCNSPIPAISQMAQAFMGQTPPSPKVRYTRLLGKLSRENLVKIGQGASWYVESYVDGSYKVIIQDNEGHEITN